MPKVEQQPAGSFCWAELATSDPAAAKSFYGDLFQWGFQDQLLGGESFYTILQVQGADAAGMYGITAKQKAQGVPPHWMVYFLVNSADESAAKTEELGGKVFAGPFDVQSIGRMAFAEDPTGAKFAMWQPREHRGTRIINEIGTPAWPELITPDTAKARSFYTGLLGWGAKDSSAAGEYTEWQLGGQSIGGMMRMDERWGEAPPHWMIYIMVTDCDAVVAKATQSGGTVCVPATDIPDVGRFAMLLDPQGAAFSIIQLRGMQQ